MSWTYSRTADEKSLSIVGNRVMGSQKHTNTRIEETPVFKAGDLKIYQCACKQWNIGPLKGTKL